MERDMSGFNNEITNTFDIMRISKRQKLVGSASIVGNVITNDYDLNEIFESRKNPMGTLTKLHDMFRSKFETIYNSSDKWIIDFKCGEYNNEPIRWSMEDIHRGYKCLATDCDRLGSSFGSNRIHFVDCLIQYNTKTKLDVVLLLNNRFIEISELYYIRIDGKSNFNEDEFNRSYVIEQLCKDMEELVDEGNYFKALKRKYRILSILGKDKKQQDKLTELFNGKYGYLYYAISQLKTLVSMKEQRFRPIDKSIFLSVQQNIKDDIGKILNYKHASSMLDTTISITVINNIIDYLTRYLNYRIKKYM